MAHSHLLRAPQNLTAEADVFVAADAEQMKPFLGEFLLYFTTIEDWYILPSVALWTFKVFKWLHDFKMQTRNAVSVHVRVYQCEVKCCLKRRWCVSLQSKHFKIEPANNQPIEPIEPTTV